MYRRGISEAVSAVLLLAVIATVSYFALSGSSKRTIDNERSVSDAIELKGSQVQELLSVISTNVSDTISVELLNYGQKDIVIDQVFVDGSPLSFTLSDSDGNVFTNHTMLPRQIMTLQINSIGQSIQIVTDSKNLIDIPL